MGFGTMYGNISLDFGTMYGRLMVKKNLIEIKLGFWDNVRKYNGKNLIEIKLGICDNVLKYNGKNIIEIKLGFWDMNVCCKPCFCF